MQFKCKCHYNYMNIEVTNYLRMKFNISANKQVEDVVSYCWLFYCRFRQEYIVLFSNTPLLSLTPDICHNKMNHCRSKQMLNVVFQGLL